jgi:hypothetical protein
VELKLAGTNQRGEVTAPGTAIVILPSRNTGPVVLPAAPDEVSQRGAAILQEAADRVQRGQA